MNTFKTVSFENKIIVYLPYWFYDSKNTYSFYIDNKLVKETNKTHFTFTNLKENTSYKIKVRINNLVKFKTVKTLKKREIINVQDFGIDNSGKTNITRELQGILDKSSQKTVYFPKGIYLVGALFLKEDTHLYLEKDAVILGSENYKDYLPKVKSRFEGIENLSYASLINIGNHNYKNKCHKSMIYIYGEGEIRGGGKPLLESIINFETPFVDASNLDLTKTNPSLIAGRTRGRLIQASNIDGLFIDGVKLGYSPSWNLHLIYSKNIVISNCYFESKDVHNGDGIDPDSSKNVDIFGCTFNTGDDCVAIKSGKNPEGNKIARASKNISVFDCKSIIGHGCCIGSEISGGVKNVFFYDCDFEKTRYGVQIKTTKKRGGYVKNVFVKDLSLPSINIRCVPYNDDGVSSGKLTTFKNFHFSNILLSSIDIGNLGNEIVKTNSIEIKGFEENKKSFKNIYFSGITFKNDKKIVNVNTTNVVIKEQFE